MKRMLTVIVCMMLIFALAACGGGEPAKDRIRVDNVIGMTVDQAIETLTKNGVVNIVTNRDDYADVEPERIIVVSQNDTEGKEIEPEWEVKLTCRRLCSVYVEATSKSNLLLHTYDMEIYLDDEMIGTAANGETVTGTVDAVEGEHTLKAVKASNNDVTATKKFTVAGETTVTALIAHGGKIEFEEFESSAGIGENVSEITEIESVPEVPALETVPEETEPVETEAATVPYSTNTIDTVANGNSGVYAYKSVETKYDIYYIVDFDEGYVYNFTEGQGDNGCYRMSISGDLNTEVEVLWHDGDSTYTETIRFTVPNQPEEAVYYAGASVLKLKGCDLETACAIRDTKKMYDY